MRWYHAETKVLRENVMVWLGVCSSKNLAPVMILDEETVDCSCYIKNVLLVTLKYGNEIFGDNCIFQQDGAKSQRHY